MVTLDHLFPATNIITELQPDGKGFFTGSRLVDPERAVDIDIVILDYPDREARMAALGYERTGRDQEYPNSSLVQTYRKGDLNIIVVDEASYPKWRKATALLVHMQLKEKHQRVTLFQFITEGQVRNSEIKYND